MSGVDNIFHKPPGYPLQLSITISTSRIMSRGRTYGNPSKLSNSLLAVEDRDVAQPYLVAAFNHLGVASIGFLRVDGVENLKGPPAESQINHLGLIKGSERTSRD